MSSHVVERLSAFLDGEMPEAERREVQTHLDACSSCRERLLELGLVDETARGLEVQAPDGYFEALPGRVRERLRTRRRRAALPAWGLAAAAALLVAVVTPLLRHDPLAPRSVPAAAPQAPPPQAMPDQAPAPVAEPSFPSRPAGPAAMLEQAPAPAKKESRGAAREINAPESVTVPPASREEPKDAPRDAAKSAEAASAPEEGFAAPPAPAPAAPAPREEDADEEKLQAGAEAGGTAPPPAASGYAATGKLAKARRKQDEEQGRADGTERSKRLGLLSPKSAEEARALREDWRRRASRGPGGPEGDEARVATIEAGAQAYRLSGESQDLEVLRRDADAYLAREDARQRERVRELLRSVEGR